MEIDLIVPIRNTAIDQIWAFYKDKSVKVFRRQRENPDHKWNDWELLGRIV